MLLKIKMMTDGDDFTVYYFYELLQIAACLLDHGAKVNQGDFVEFSPIHIACNFGHDKVVTCIHVPVLVTH